MQLDEEAEASGKDWIRSENQRKKETQEFSV